MGIINSMTPAERTKPELIKASRKRRIAAGAGVTVQEVNQLLNQFEQTQKMMKMVAQGRHAEDAARNERSAARHALSDHGVLFGIKALVSIFERARIHAGYARHLAGGPLSPV